MSRFNSCRQALSLAGIGLLLLVACAESGGQGALDRPMAIKWNKFRTIEEEALLVGFLDVLDDTRCLEGCESAGEAVVLLRVMKDGARLDDVAVAIDDATPQPVVVVDRYRIQLLGLSPEDSPRDRGRYVLTLTVSRH